MTIPAGFHAQSDNYVEVVLYKNFHGTKTQPGSCVRGPYKLSQIGHLTVFQPGDYFLSATTAI